MLNDNFNRQFNRGGEWNRTIRTTRRMGVISILVYLIFLACLAILIGNLFLHPEIIGQFFGRISEGFHSVK